MKEKEEEKQVVSKNVRMEKLINKGE